MSQTGQMIELCCEYLSVRCIWLYVLDKTRTCSQEHTWQEHTVKCTVQKYWQHRSIIWPVWLIGWVFVYELSGCGIESSCSHIYTFTYQKALLIKLFCLLLKSSKAFSVSLSTLIQHASQSCPAGRLCKKRFACF